MPLRRWLALILGLFGILVFATGLHGYMVAEANHTDDPESVLAATQAAMRHLPIVAFGFVFLLAAGVAWWRERDA